MWLHMGLRDLRVFGKHLVASKGGCMLLRKGSKEHDSKEH